MQRRQVLLASGLALSAMAGCTGQADDDGPDDDGNRRSERRPSEGRPEPWAGLQHGTAAASD